MKSSILTLLLGCICLVPTTGNAQVNSGSDGHDGAFNPTQSVEIDMDNHPDGIYQYTSVNIPSGVSVTFKSNAKNSAVVWLVQTTCIINGTVDVSGQSTANGEAGDGGPGGFSGGSGGTIPRPGQGPGSAAVGGLFPNASYGGLGDTGSQPPGPIYGNVYLLPLLGGSGGGGTFRDGVGPGGGGGGGGAILIVSSISITLNGEISARGGDGAYQSYSYPAGGGAASGGGIRLVSQRIVGTGFLNASGGQTGRSDYPSLGGKGRIRLDVFENGFGGTINGVFTEGFQPIIIPAAGQGVQLSIASIAGTAVSQNPSGVLANPDVIIPSQQTNPLPVVVSCSNIPLNTEVKVIVHPANGPDVQAVAMNNAGTLAASSATVSLNMPRGGGIIYARCVSGVANLGVDTSSKELRTKSLAETGWTADGERFAKMEIGAALGGSQQITYISESGKRYPLAIR